MFSRTIGGLVVSAALVWCSTAGAEDVANPVYTRWAKFKVGSWATLKTEATAAGNTTKVETTQKLVALTPESATVEITTSMDAGGQKMTMPAQKMEFKAKTPGGTGTAAVGANPDVKESTEDVKVGDKTVKCRVIEAKTEAGGMTMKSKTWMSDEVPGSTVKMESTGEGAMKSQTTMTLTSFEAK